MADVCDRPVQVQDPALPDGTKPLSTQVAGHFYGKSVSKLGFLEAENGVVLKPLIPGKGDSELRFYNEVFDPAAECDVLLGVRQLVPKFCGTWTTPQQPGVTYLKLENITQQFRQPSVMDIKVGPISYNFDDKPEKIQREKTKFAPQLELGFRLLGIKIFQRSSQSYVFHENADLKKWTEDAVFHTGFVQFMHKNEPDFQPELVQALLRKLRRVSSWFGLQKRYHFVASSLLIVYEGESHPPQTALELQGVDAKENGASIWDSNVDVRLIDFTHHRAANTKDGNFITGLNSVIKHFQRLLE